MMPLFHHGMMILGIPYTAPSLNTTTSGGTPYGATHVSGVDNRAKLTPDEIALAQYLGEHLARTTIKLNS